MRWTQKLMSELAQEERAALGFALDDAFDPYLLAEEHGIDVYPLNELREWDLSEAAFDYFFSSTSGNWSSALVPFGTARIIIDNDGHASVRRRASIAHEMGHHLLEHQFDGAFVGGDHKRLFDPTREKQADYVAAQLMVPDDAAFRAAKLGMTDVDIASAFDVSLPYARMRMARARIVAARYVAKYGR